MAGEDVERLKAGMEAYARGDFEAAFQDLDPEFELRDHMIPEGSATGSDAPLTNRRHVSEAFSDVTYQPLEYIDLEGRILVRVLGVGKGRQTGIEFREETGQLWTLRDGRAVRLDVYRTWTQAKRAAGLEA